MEELLDLIVYIAGGMAFCITIHAATSWLQIKLDEWNKKQDNQQLNNAEQ